MKVVRPLLFYSSKEKIPLAKLILGNSAALHLTNIYFCEADEEVPVKDLCAQINGLKVLSGIVSPGVVESHCLKEGARSLFLFDGANIKGYAASSLDIPIEIDGKDVLWSSVPENSICKRELNWTLPRLLKDKTFYIHSYRREVGYITFDLRSRRFSKSGLNRGLNCIIWTVMQAPAINRYPMDFV